MLYFCFYCKTFIKAQNINLENCFCFKHCCRFSKRINIKVSLDGLIGVLLVLTFVLSFLSLSSEN